MGNTHQYEGNTIKYQKEENVWKTPIDGVRKKRYMYDVLVIGTIYRKKQKKKSI